MIWFTQNSQNTQNEKIAAFGLRFFLFLSIQKSQTEYRISSDGMGTVS